MIQQKLYKLFCPDLMFNDFVKTGWCTNIETIEGKIPIHKELKAKNVFAINIKPNKEHAWFAFSFPLNKQWTLTSLNHLKKPVLQFDTIGCDTYKLKVSFVDDKGKDVHDINIEDTENWNHFELEVKNRNIKIVEFSGSTQIDNFIMKEIKIVDKG